MAMSYSLMMASLKIGVDLCTETDAEDVPEVYDAAHRPVYTLQELRDDVWEDLMSPVPSQALPDVVEGMHWDYEEPVRLLEDGHPVFTCGRLG